MSTKRNRPAPALCRMRPLVTMGLNTTAGKSASLATSAALKVSTGFCGTPSPLPYGRGSIFNDLLRERKNGHWNSPAFEPRDDGLNRAARPGYGRAPATIFFVQAVRLGMVFLELFEVLRFVFGHLAFFCPGGRRLGDAHDDIFCVAMGDDHFAAVFF